MPKPKPLFSSDVPSPESSPLPFLSKISTTRSSALSANGTPVSKHASSPDSPVPRWASQPPLSQLSDQPIFEDAVTASTRAIPPYPSLKTWFPPRPDRESVASTADSPTLGVGEKVQFRTISQVSAENAPSSLEEAAQTQSNMDILARLTVHQNQMESFGSSFPPDLVIPAIPTIPDSFKGQKAESNLQAFASDTASKELEIPDDHSKGRNGAIKSGLSRQSSVLRPFSFISFEDVPAEQFAIKTPVTPKPSTFEINKMYGQGLRPGKANPPLPPLPLDAEYPQYSAYKLPRTRQSGRRKLATGPASINASRSEPQSPNEEVQGSSAEGFHSRPPARRLHSDTILAPPVQPSQRKESDPAPDRLRTASDVPDNRQIPGSEAKGPKDNSESPPSTRRQRHASLLKGLGIRTTLERPTPAKRSTDAFAGESRSHEPTKIESYQGDQHLPKPLKSRNTGPHERSTSDATPVRSTTLQETTPERGKKRHRFSGLGSLFTKPNPRKSSLLRATAFASSQERQPLQKLDQNASGSQYLGSTHQPHVSNNQQSHDMSSRSRTQQSIHPSERTFSDLRKPDEAPSALKGSATQASPPRKGVPLRVVPPNRQNAPPAHGHPSLSSSVPTSTGLKPEPIVTTHPALRTRNNTTTSISNDDDTTYDDTRPPTPPPKDEIRPAPRTTSLARKPGRTSKMPSSPHMLKEGSSPNSQGERPKSLLSAFPTPPSSRSRSSPSQSRSGDRLTRAATQANESPSRRRKHHKSLPLASTQPATDGLGVQGAMKPSLQAPTGPTVEEPGPELVQTPATAASGARPRTPDAIKGASPPPAYDALGEDEKDAEGERHNEDEPTTPKASASTNDGSTTPKAAQPTSEPAANHGKTEGDSDDEEIVMTSTSGPLDEWHPAIGAWDGD